MTMSDSQPAVTPTPVALTSFDFYACSTAVEVDPNLPISAVLSPHGPN